MPAITDNLKEKGWSEEEIEKALQIMHAEEKQQKHIHIKKDMNRTIYWTVLLALTIGNFLISIIMIPFLLVLETFQVEVIVTVIGLVFGSLFSLIIRDIEHIEPKHHLAAAVFIPAIAIINIFVMVSVANTFSLRMDFDTTKNPVIVSIFYVGAFLVPYIIGALKDFVKTRSGYSS